jgi:hypothetical protein
MNPKYFGDSYDIVKRFFCNASSVLGYTVYIEPMLTDEWSDSGAAFYRFLGAKHVRIFEPSHASFALFIDPDAGISKRESVTHISFDRLTKYLDEHAIVFAFDQSFSRSSKVTEQMDLKLAALESLGCQGFYYDSHARFLFASNSDEHLRTVEDHLISIGLPKCRIVRLTNSKDT